MPHHNSTSEFKYIWAKKLLFIIIINKNKSTASAPNKKQHHREVWHSKEKQWSKETANCSPLFFHVNQFLNPVSKYKCASKCSLKLCKKENTWNNTTHLIILFVVWFAYISRSLSIEWNNLWGFSLYLPLLLVHCCCHRTIYIYRYRDAVRFSFSLFWLMNSKLLLVDIGVFSPLVFAVQIYKYFCTHTLRQR